MESLNERVQKTLEIADEEYHRLGVLQQQRADAFSKLTEKLHETAKSLEPVMKKVRENHFKFRGVGNDYVSSRGPVLGHDKQENILYIFEVDRMMPITVDLYDDEVKGTTYRKLVEKFDFSNMMDSLLLVLEHHDYIRNELENTITAMESELLKYQ